MKRSVVNGATESEPVGNPRLEHPPSEEMGGAGSHDDLPVIGIADPDPAAIIHGSEDPRNAPIFADIESTVRERRSLVAAPLSPECVHKPARWLALECAGLRTYLVIAHCRRTSLV